jgi:hypothetical protein
LWRVCSQTAVLQDLGKISLPKPPFSVTYVPGVVHYSVTLACRPQEFSTVAATQFGSGWAWLVDNHVTSHENTKGRKPPRSW